ncbi:uncharacterized protein LOC134529541 [Bacillus rossius redtenbacheri]|uniref:uncharacterized protein LOC134529541 n=1 Tax=Bacillus rossius redtenbacheri TaxID=93214 RepID=UPI002FDD3641
MDNSEHFSNVIEVTTERGRKRNRRKETWTREISKRERYTSKSLPRKPQCGHDTKTYKCTTLAMQDIRRFHQAFYATSRKTSQDSFILKYTSQMSPKRTSRSKVANSSRKTSSNKYYVKTLHGPVQVCATTFLSILGISRYRVHNLCRKHLSTGYSPKENRGGERSNKIYEAKRNAVCEFIKKLQPVEEHYTKNKTKCQYLECDLSMKKLWRIYNGSNDSEFKVKYSLFRHIFQYNFNISFKTPRTDACSTCLQLTNQMKAATTGSEEKFDLMVKLRVHKLKASAFYSQIKERRTERTVVFTYDCQKNLVLPRVPDQAAYYSRQMFMYNFTMCRGHSKAPQNKDTVTMYAWLENERLKGSNEIASAIIDTLRTADLSDGDIECIQLCSDGCPGQNKNSIVIGVVMKWLGG